MRKQKTGREIWAAKKALIFDLDGTMIDSMGVWKEIDDIFLAQRGYVVPPDLQQQIEGMSFLETAEYFKERFDLKESAQELMELWNQMAEEWYTTKLPLKPGLEEFLKEVGKSRLRFGIATSNARSLVEAVLAAHGLLEQFQTIQTADEIKKGKPAPDVYLAAAEKLGIQPEECLVFEDVIMGIRSGKNAGMEVCAVYDRYAAGQEEQKQELADYYIRDYRELL